MKKQMKIYNKDKKVSKQILTTLVILLFGAALGTFSKYLDYRQAQLPYLLHIMDERLDFHNFLGSFAPWILIAVCISVKSASPVRAAVNVFAFFTGMVSCYYLYTNFIAGFFPRNYAMIWFALTMVSPFMAFFCWYARENGKAAVIFSAGILAVLFNLTFSYGLIYFDVRSIMHVVVFIAAILPLRKSPAKTLVMMGMAIIIAISVKIILPFHLW